MIIRDLEVLEVVAEDNQIEGGIAISDASASAFADGNFFAGTSTFTSTSATDVFIPFFGSFTSASSFSGSSSAAD